MRPADHQHLGDVARTEDSVDGGELLGLERGEVRRKRAVLRAPPAEELAGGAGGDGVEGSGRV